MLRHALRALRNALMYPLPESWGLAWWCFAVDLIIVWWLCKWFVYLPPSPGVAIASLAGLGIVISIKGSPTKLEKLIWFTLSALLIIVELHSIRLDRQVNQDEQIVLRAQERESFLLVMRNESRDFRAMLTRTQEIMLGQEDLRRSDIQRVSETYQISAELMSLAHRVWNENPDNHDNLWGHYEILRERAGNNRKAQEKVAQQFKIAKRHLWDGWQGEVDRDLPILRDRESELRKRLPYYEPTPPPNVARFLQTGVLNRNAGIDSQNMIDTAEYLRRLAYDFTAPPANIVRR